MPLKVSFFTSEVAFVLTIDICKKREDSSELDLVVQMPSGVRGPSVVELSRYEGIWHQLAYALQNEGVVSCMGLWDLGGTFNFFFGSPNSGFRGLFLLSFFGAS